MTQTPKSAHPAADIVAEVISSEHVVINGTQVPVSAEHTPYDEVYQQAQTLAQQKGQQVVVQGIDAVRSERSWFTVTPDGQVSTIPAAEPKPEPKSEPEPAPITEPEPEPEPARSRPEQKTEAPMGQWQHEPAQQTSPARQPDSAETSVTPDKPLDSRAERRRIAEAEHAFVSAVPEKPRSGVRKVIYDLTGGVINMGPSEKELKEEELKERIARPLRGSRNTAILSLKGGIGKTSTTVGVGMTLADIRGDTPCAIDANPDSGDLVERALGERAFQAQQPRSITDLLKMLDGIDSLTQLQGYLQQAGRLHVLAGEQDPALSDSLTAEEWKRVHAEFAKYYPVILTDCGTGVSHNAMEGILQTADNIIIAAGFAVSGAQRALQTLEWLSNHGYAELAKESIVVITDKETVSERVNKQAIQDSLRGYCRKLVVVPFDRAVVDGDRINLDTLQEETRWAYMDIAAAMVDGYK